MTQQTKQRITAEAKRTATTPDRPFANRYISWRQTPWWVEDSDVPGYLLFWDTDAESLSFLASLDEVIGAVARGEMFLDC